MSKSPRQTRAEKLAVDEVLYPDIKARREAIMATVEESVPPTEELILAMLNQHRKGIHGVGITEEISRQSEGQLRIASGTLYPALKRMKKRGWTIDELESEEDARAQGRAGGAIRRYWKLTNEGERIIERVASIYEIRSRFLRTKSNK